MCRKQSNRVFSFIFENKIAILHKQNIDLSKLLNSNILIGELNKTELNIEHIDLKE